MGYNVESLPKYINESEYAEGFLMASILGGSTLDFLSDNGAYRGDGVQGATSAIHLMKNTLIYQDGKTCNLQDLSETELSQAQIYVAPIAFNAGYCAIEDLPEVWASEEIKKRKKGIVLDEVIFGDAILEDLTNQNKAELEKMIWQSSKLKTGNLRFFDGFLVQLENATNKVDLSTVSGTDIVAKVKNAYLKMPVEVTGQADFRIWMSQDKFNEYKSVIADKNYFHQSEDGIVKAFGTNGIIQITEGLNSQNKVVFARPRNLQAKGDLDKDTATFKAIYNDSTEKLVVRSRFGLGAKVIFAQEIGVLDLGA